MPNAKIRTNILLPTQRKEKERRILHLFSLRKRELCKLKVVFCGVNFWGGD
jgi:hypothetical protein